jgi:hypothetical protein
MFSFFKSTPTPQKPLSLPDNFKEEHYLSILETYGVKWNLIKVGRDIIQNFFDAKGSAEDVNTQLTKLGGIFSTSHLLRIAGPAEYDYRNLIHLGGSDKTDSAVTAGGFGEGAKIVALVLLRDFNCSGVRFGSADWELEFTLQPPPEGSYGKEGVRGLYATVSKVEHAAGNFIEFITPDKKTADTIAACRDLFYYPAHPDFKNATVEVQLKKGGRMGFTYHGVRTNGRLYDAGQRRHYREGATQSLSEGWNRVEGLTVWSLGRKFFDIDRDRGAVEPEDVQEKMFPTLAAAMWPEQIENSIMTMRDVWKDGSFYGTAAKRLLECLLEEANKRRLSFTFPEQCVADSPYSRVSVTDELKRLGYMVCEDRFSHLGMQSIDDLCKKLAARKAIVPNQEQEIKIGVLCDAIKLVNTKLSRAKRVPVVEIALYNPRTQPNALQTNSRDTAWLSTKVLEQEFHLALVDYIQLKGFASDVLPKVIGMLIEDNQSFKKLRDTWHLAGKFDIIIDPGANDSSPGLLAIDQPQAPNGNHFLH